MEMIINCINQLVSWENAWKLSLGLLIILVFFGIYLFNIGKRKKCVRILFVATLVSSCIVLLPKNINLPFIERAFVTLHDTLQVYSLDGSYADLIKHVPDAYKHIYSVYSSFLYFACPVLAFSAVMSYFVVVVNRLKLKFVKKKYTYIFSKLSDKTLELAKSAYHKNKKIRIIFCDVYNDESERSYELEEEADKLHAICLKNDITTLPLHKWKLQKFYYFIINDDYKERIKHAINIIDKYKEDENVKLYVFDDTVAGEKIIGSKITIDDFKMTVRRINETVLTIYNYLYETDVLNGVSGDYKVVVTGNSHYAFEMIKALTWYVQQENVNLKLYVFDHTEKLKKRLSDECPELMKYRSILLNDDKHYFIRFYKIDGESPEFKKKLGEIGEFNISYVLYDQDLKNIMVSTIIDSYIQAKHMDATVETYMEDALLHETMKPDGNRYPVHSGNFIKDNNKKIAVPHRIHLLNETKSLYDLVIEESKLEDPDNYKFKLTGDTIETAYMGKCKLHKPDSVNMITKALWIHTDYSKQKINEISEEVEKFFKYDYFYKSSLSRAIREKKYEDMCDLSQEYDYNDIKKQVYYEHIAWVAYMRSEGFCLDGNAEYEEKDIANKTHSLLIDYDQLNKATKLYNVYRIFNISWKDAKIDGCTEVPPQE